MNGFVILERQFRNGKLYLDWRRGWFSKWYESEGVALEAMKQARPMTEFNVSDTGKYTIEYKVFEFKIDII